MKSEIKNLYSALLCKRGYVRGLKETGGSDMSTFDITEEEWKNLSSFVIINMEIKQMKNKAVVVFDLDGTLAESKSEITKEMVELLERILSKYSITIAILSGCTLKQMEKQFLAKFKDDSKFAQILLMPTCGAEMYKYTYDKTWEQIYSNNLVLREKVRIYNAFCNAVAYYNNFVRRVGFDDWLEIDTTNLVGKYGEIAEDRGAQVTFSLLGQEAPSKDKAKYDPRLKKRGELVAAMRGQLKDEYEVRIGGATSIDVTKKGIDKAFGVRNILDRYNLRPTDAVFIGDALFDGGNDHAVRSTGVECVKTTGPEDTIKILKREFFGE